MISHAVILCGGAGTRMREAGYDQPKFLLPIEDKNISFFIFKNLKKYGIESVHLLLGDSSEEILSELQRTASVTVIGCNMTPDIKGSNLDSRSISVTT